MKKIFIMFTGLALTVLTTHFSFAVDLFKKEKFNYDSQGKRDPFFSIDSIPKDTEVLGTTAVTAAEKIKDIHITSIIYGPPNSSILIGDDILSVGQTIPGYSNVMIRKIDKDYVVFEVDGEMVESSIAN